MSENKKIILEKLGKNRDIIKIKFLEPLSSKLLTTYLTAAFNKCFNNCYYKIILDLTNIDNLEPDFVATLIEATAKVRTKDGDVKIINASEQAEHALAAFNAYAYLTVPKEGEN
jgi:hypothetical protein